MEDKKDPHEAQWRNLFAMNTDLSKEKGDKYDCRAQACIRLIEYFC